MVNLDQQKLLARHLTPADIHDALMQQYLVLPAGDIKIKQTDWIVQTNASPMKIDAFRRYSRSSGKATHSSICATSPRYNSWAGCNRTRCW